jgi:uncharacterized protein YbjT (DUF2867 family)
MRIAITGGTGFVGRHLALELLNQGHEVVLVARGVDRREPGVLDLPGVQLARASLTSVDDLVEAFRGADAVAHSAGINREMGAQTYERIHVQGTRNVVAACQEVGVGRLAMVSFLRARPNCGSVYHESKWAAEEIIRSSGLDYTILKCGVIYGPGDHMLDHLSHAFHTFPLFGLVGFRDRLIRPVAVEDVAHLLARALTEGVLSHGTYAVTGPEELTLTEAVQRVARVVGREPLWVRLPVWLHLVLARFWEAAMRVPLVSLAQVRILDEGLVEPALPCAELPESLRPRAPFSPSQIQRGVPNPARFGRADLRCCAT